jgi:hypothetical protein
MTYEEFVQAERERLYGPVRDAIREGKPFTTRQCQDCGAESTLFFGFVSGCRYNGGSHRTIIEVPTALENEANKLRAAYSCAMWFDREKFDKYFPSDLAEKLFSMVVK